MLRSPGGPGEPVSCPYSGGQDCFSLNFSSQSSTRPESIAAKCLTEHTESGGKWHIPQLCLSSFRALFYLARRSIHALWNTARCILILECSKKGAVEDPTVKGQRNKSGYKSCCNPLQDQKWFSVGQVGFSQLTKE